ncbi:UDP-N-acetylmuramate dehydrogenase [Nostocoides jenkinsii]|uniref:UDP-N-acetylenolpyruvoylglucosamine reductase n=1 Tax=Nostocoides jenkinsii Ben 74 TaxID=1193518 RepID=A0A077MCZ1_9MICO|nr:UDP-N-acetylmuramate dehydrogenase [Tetrasphaera jenkinsii]CCI54434.1 UDP-N-acetylenolpyruvoylglucosamine reductase [Tetrasphaera jenkinsii Ben 74]
MRLTGRTEKFDAALAPHTTMRVGGPAQRLVTVTSNDELVDAVRETDDAGEPLLVLGGGSNVVIPDGGFPGTVVKVATTGVTRESIDACSGAFVRVAAGEVWDEVVAQAVASGWSGVEALSGIPGSAGATPVQNVGAYGQEVAQTIAQVRTWDRQAQAVRTFSALECAFTYRHSIFKATDRFVVLDVVFQFVLADLCRPIAYADLATQLGVAVGDRVPLADAREAVLAQRRRRGMVLDPADHDTWSCGSFFTNPILSTAAFDALVARVHDRLGADIDPPRFADADGNVKTSAAWLIERAGFGKGFGADGEAGLSGRASLSTKHTLALTNRGFATAADILALAAVVRDGVHAAFGVALVNEPVLLGQAF